MEMEGVSGRHSREGYDVGGRYLTTAKHNTDVNNVRPGWETKVVGGGLGVV